MNEGRIVIKLMYMSSHTRAQRRLGKASFCIYIGFSRPICTLVSLLYIFGISHPMHICITILYLRALTGQCILESLYIFGIVWGQSRQVKIQSGERDREKFCVLRGQVSIHPIPHTRFVLVLTKTYYLCIINHPQ